MAAKSPSSVFPCLSLTAASTSSSEMLMPISRATCAFNTLSIKVCNAVLARGSLAFPGGSPGWARSYISRWMRTSPFVMAPAFTRATISSSPGLLATVTLPTPRSRRTNPATLSLWVNLTMCVASFQIRGGNNFQVVTPSSSVTLTNQPSVKRAYSHAVGRLLPWRHLRPGNGARVPTHGIRDARDAHGQRRRRSSLQRQQAVHVSHNISHLRQQLRIVDAHLVLIGSRHHDIVATAAFRPNVRTVTAVGAVQLHDHRVRCCVDDRRFG